MVEDVTDELSKVQRETFIEEARTSGDRFESLYVMSLMTGLRLSEALALRWSDVDTKAGVLSVERVLVVPENGPSEEFRFGPPKIGARRTIWLGPVAREALFRQRDRQEEERAVAADEWQDMDLIFTSETGRSLDPRHVSERFKSLAKRVGYPSMRFIDLRRVFAQTALA